MKKGDSCPAPRRTHNDPLAQTNYATIDVERLEVNQDMPADTRQESLVESVNEINPDMNSMDSRG